MTSVAAMGGENGGIPPIQFAKSRGARIAWQRFGAGPTVVAIPPTAQNIEVAWEWPQVRVMFERFGSFSTWVQFDKRGSGSSDRRSNHPGIDERVEDLRAVMDDAGIERAFLYGASEGGPTCVLFAVTYPDRVEGLILHGTGPYTSPPGLVGEELEQMREAFDAFVSTYGTRESMMVDGFAPSIANEPGFREWHQRYERLSATPDSLREILEISLTVDVTDALEHVEVPTLVLHASGDLIIPVDWGRELANQIENAQLHVYDSIDHFGYVDLKWVDELERFVTGRVAERPTVRAPGKAYVRTLGRFAVSIDGKEVPNAAWGSRRSRQLCKRLVAARGRPVRREELAEQLWPDEGDYRKLGPRLSVQLSAVKRVLGGAVIADRETVALDLNEVSTDLEQFMEVAEPRAITELFTGDFLPSDVDEGWATGTRDEVRSRFTSAARSLLADAATANETVARQLVELDRWDDGGHRSLIQLLWKDGRISDARRAHDVYAVAMGELDVEVDAIESIVGESGSG